MCVCVFWLAQPRGEERWRWIRINGCHSSFVDCLLRLVVALTKDEQLISKKKMNKNGVLIGERAN